MAASPTFDDPHLLDWLLSAEDDEIDRLDFGVIGLDARLVCTRFNATEAEQSGLPAERVLGRPFFEQTAPCMNNFLVSDRLSSETPLDEVINYTLSVRVTPTAVRLRMLTRPGEEKRFLVIDWKAGA